MVFSVDGTTDGARRGGGPSATALAREGLAWLTTAALCAVAAILGAAHSRSV